MSETLDSRAIQRILPHRYPFLLVDRVTILEPGKRARGVKAVSGNEPFFQGHFPGRPIMPGVLILEAMAQVGGVLMGWERPPEQRGNSLMVFAGIDRVRFRRPVLPGDVLDLEVEVLNLRMRTVKLKGKAVVEGNRAAEAELLAALTEVEP